MFTSEIAEPTIFLCQLCTYPTGADGARQDAGSFQHHRSAAGGFWRTGTGVAI
jgi:hypothetical protein